METKKPFFDSNTTDILKGIALILMLIHHFFTYPSWWGEGVSYPLIAQAAPYICAPFRICVPVFCFLTGYVYYFAKEKTFIYSFKKIGSLLVSYWMVFFPVALIAVIFVPYRYNLRDFLTECIAFYCPTMPFCWYVNFYLTMMLLLPLLVRILTRSAFFDLAVTVLLIPFFASLAADPFVENEIVLQLRDNITEWMPVALSGYLCAARGLFFRAKDLESKILRNKAVRVLFFLLLALSAAAGRFVFPHLQITTHRLPVFFITADTLYAPLFVYAAVRLAGLLPVPFAHRALAVTGRYSLWMWFVSCVFYGITTPLFQPLLYLPKNPLLVLLWGYFLCFVPSLLLEKEKRLFFSRKMW
ncbi:MAG: acyltransferase family protein [Lachnospiraceae bacterium]|nr:acyltransferase family protein [Lachnospiraceae bacterium]